MELNVSIRNASGTNAAKKMRRIGSVPAVVNDSLGKGVAIALEAKSLNKIHEQGNLLGRTFTLIFPEKKIFAAVKNADINPISRELENIQFQALDKPFIKLSVPINYIGSENSNSIKRGAILHMLFRFVKISFSKDKVISSIDIDISNLSVGQIIRFKDIILPEGVSLAEKNPNVCCVRMTGRKGAKAAEDTEVATTETKK